jgi:hypothetical protein
MVQAAMQIKYDCTNFTITSRNYLKNLQTALNGTSQEKYHGNKKADPYHYESALSMRVGLLFVIYKREILRIDSLEKVQIRCFSRLSHH